MRRPDRRLQFLGLGKTFFWILNVKGVHEAQKCRFPTCVQESQFLYWIWPRFSEVELSFYWSWSWEKEPKINPPTSLKKVGEHVWKAPAASSGGRPPSSGLLRRSAGQGGEGGAKGHLPILFAETSTLGKFAAGNYQCYIEIVAIELYKHI